jgi:phosphoglycolate phosphatase
LLAAVLFDFDGTLVDTRSASWPLFERTNAEFDLGINTKEQFFALFRSNLYQGLLEHCGEASRGAAAAAHFMAQVRDHYDPPLIPGMSQLLPRLAGELTLAIVSSNTKPTIDRILEREGLGACFSAVVAGDLEPSKTRAIERFLAGDWGPACAPAATVLISDTTGDVAEANAAGTRAFGVCWGMHSRDDLLAAGAVGTAANVEELQRWIELENTQEGGQSNV